MVVRDDAGRPVTAYLVPMTYRGSPLAGADGALIGTAEHGVLGTRWIYDGTADPVLLEQLAELVRGGVGAQAQSQSDTPDATVQVTRVAAVSGQRVSISFARQLNPVAPCLVQVRSLASGRLPTAGWCAASSREPRR